MSCQSKLTEPTIGPDYTELNGSCRACPSSIDQAGLCSCWAKSCGTHVGPFSTGQICMYLSAHCRPNHVFSSPVYAR
jgi:hypothetical protein